jgi:hypothetical protein
MTHDQHPGAPDPLQRVWMPEDFAATHIAARATDGIALANFPSRSTSAASCVSSRHTPANTPARGWSRSG